MEFLTTIGAEQAEQVDSATSHRPTIRLDLLKEAKSIIGRHTRVQLQQNDQIKELAALEKQVRSDLHYARLRITMKNRTIRAKQTLLDNARKILAQSRIDAEVAAGKLQDLQARRALIERDIQMAAFREVFPGQLK